MKQHTVINNNEALNEVLLFTINFIGANKIDN